MFTYYFQFELDIEQITWLTLYVSSFPRLVSVVDIRSMLLLTKLSQD